MINKHKSNKIKENSNTVRHLNKGTDHRHSKSCCDQSSPARRTIMGAMVSQIISRTIVYSTIYSGTDQRKHQSSASLAFVLGIHRWLVNSPHKWTVMRKMFPFDGVIMEFLKYCKSALSSDIALVLNYIIGLRDFQKYGPRDYVLPCSNPYLRVDSILVTTWVLQFYQLLKRYSRV